MNETLIPMAVQEHHDYITAGCSETGAHGEGANGEDYICKLCCMGTYALLNFVSELSI